MNLLFALTLTILGAICLASAAEASMQPQMYCWDPDLEFPVSCNEEGDEGDARADGCVSSSAPASAPARRRRLS
jgi:hypothetical protein